MTLEQELSVLEKNQFLDSGVKEHIKQNLNEKLPLRPYQIKAFERFFYYARKKDRPNPLQLLFHMATGSGKTLIMAGLILDLYKLGYRNFIFFVHNTSIIEKTRDNFLNALSSKFLFNKTINIDNQKIKIREVQNFEGIINNNYINIVFTTIQGLHAKLNAPRENGLVYEDFKKNKIVLISDEAHHINAETKKGKRTSSEQDNIDSWEGTVTKIFNSNEENYLLEFTATADLSHSEISRKYSQKLIYNYPLKQFRIDGYSKEVNILRSDMSPFERSMRALILSQLRRKIFEAGKIHIKPVILLKSKTITENRSFYKEFVYNIKKLSVDQLEQIKEQSTDGIIKKAFHYFENKEISLDNLVLELKEDFSEERCLSVDSKDDNEEKQLLVNSLEDLDNRYRAIFAVDKLDEGWDVLNLFDIVMLYDKKTSGKNKEKIDPTTMSEAQLIGRGARYCPFQFSQDQSLFKRKFDSDIENDLRICEELYYHVAHNPEYVSDLKKALERKGLPAERKKVTLKLKENFKSTSFYKYGVVFENERIYNDRKEYTELDKSIRDISYETKFLTGETVKDDVFENEDDIKQDIVQLNRFYPFNSFSTRIIRKAINKSPFYTFKRLKCYFPNLNSITEFIEDEKYLRNIRIEFKGNKDQVGNPSNEMKLKAILKTLNEIKKEIEKGYSSHIGTKRFIPKAVVEIFNDKTKKILMNQDGSEREFGIPQSETNNPDLRIDLAKEDWYVYNENFGTSEEKHLVMYVKSIYEEYLKDNYEIYLIRNENHTKLFTFDKGIRFEPDFLFFLIDRKTSSQITYQIFMEPKGNHLISNEDSQSKEKFLSQIADAFRSDYKISNREFRLIGMPLYNKEKTASQFDIKFREITNPQA